MFSGRSCRCASVRGCWMHLQPAACSRAPRPAIERNWRHPGAATARRRRAHCIKPPRHAPSSGRSMSEPKPASEGLRNSIYKRYTGRKMSPMRRLLYRIAAPLIYALARLWWHSVRIVAVVGEEHLNAVLTQSPSFIPCYWHQHTLFCAQYLLGQRKRLRVGFLVSPSVDGELGAMVLQRAGGYVIRGSASRTGALALKEYFQ